jgi:hypothetical protein
LALRPGSVLPDPHQRRDALGRQALVTPGEQGGRDGTDRAVCHASPPQLFRRARLAAP